MKETNAIFSTDCTQTILNITSTGIPLELINTHKNDTPHIFDVKRLSSAETYPEAFQIETSQQPAP